jgi:hypothetical protein
MKKIISSTSTKIKTQEQREKARKSEGQAVQPRDFEQAEE